MEFNEWVGKCRNVLQGNIICPPQAVEEMLGCIEALHDRLVDFVGDEADKIVARHITEVKDVAKD